MARKASASASSGVMSRKTMPGLGKSGMSRMRRRRSTMPSLYHIHAPVRRPAGGQRRQVAEGLAGDVVLAHLEVEIRARCLAALPDARADIAVATLRARAQPVLALVRVGGHPADVL